MLAAKKIYVGSHRFSLKDKNFMSALILGVSDCCSLTCFFLSAGVHNIVFNATPWICVLTVWVFWPPGIKKVWTVGFYFLPPFSRLRSSFIAIIKQPWEWEHAWTQSNWTVVPGGLYLLCNSESFGYPEVQLWQQDCFSTFLLILLHIQIVGFGSTSHLAWVGMLGGQQKGMNDSFLCIL